MVFVLRLLLCAAVLVVVVVAGAAVTPAPAAQTASCVLDVSTTQICPVSFRAVVGKRGSYTVAKYEDHSRCKFPPPASYPGNNGNYRVAWISITWGDGTRSTSGVARLGGACPGTSALDSPGATAAITGTHRYTRGGRYIVLVYIKYVRGSGNTYGNCATITPKSLVYEITKNCIALKAPSRSTAIVKRS